MNTYKMAALVALAAVTLGTSGCGGGTATTTQNGGYNRSSVVKVTKDGKGGLVMDISNNGYSEDKSLEMSRTALEYSQRRLDAQNAHNERMYETAAEKMDKANKHQRTQDPTSGKQSTRSDPATMQRELYDEAMKN